MVILSSKFVEIVESWHFFLLTMLWFLIININSFLGLQKIIIFWVSLDIKQKWILIPCSIIVEFFFINIIDGIYSFLSWISDFISDENESIFSFYRVPYEASVNWAVIFTSRFCVVYKCNPVHFCRLFFFIVFSI